MSKTRIALVVLTLAACTAMTATMLAEAPAETPDLTALARQAISSDADAAEAAIEQLRAAGPAGLEALFDVHQAAIDRRREAAGAAEGDKNWLRISKAINTVAGQHDAHAARLFWYTDFQRAKAAAQATGKPILSLRMLGKLTEECSCANSRFFRTTLYANQEIAQVLREQFILHWKSVRPVPKVTIDFGDGRVLERTLTGNSIHYVLDAQGRPVDAIPGLYGPRAFLRQLEQGQQMVKSLAGADANVREALLRMAHSGRHAALTRAWAADLQKSGVEPPKDAANVSTTRSGQPNDGRAPTAREAARVVVTKSVVELPLLNRIAGTGAAAEKLTSELENATTDQVWKTIAALHAGDARLDGGSVALMREHHPTATRAAKLTVSKFTVEDPLLRMVANFQNSIALDTVRNEYLMHRRIHQWFATGEGVTKDVDQFNQRVYAELFLTPDTDPWLGLVSKDVYTGLRDNGVRDNGVRDNDVR